VFAKFRAVHQQVQLIQTIRNHLILSFRMLVTGPERVFERKIDERVWNDPYLLGYAQGAIAIMTTAYGRGLTTTQQGMVSIRVLEDLAGANWKAVCERIEKLHTSGDPEFARGAGNGGDIVALIAGKAGPALLADPEVQHALREAPGRIELTKKLLGSADTSQYGAAGTLLMQRYMEQHARDAGY
jgi:hypothetical protein